MNAMQEVTRLKLTGTPAEEAMGQVWAKMADDEGHVALIEEKPAKAIPPTELQIKLLTYLWSANIHGLKAVGKEIGYSQGHTSIGMTALVSWGWVEKVGCDEKDKRQVMYTLTDLGKRSFVRTGLGTCRHKHCANSISVRNKTFRCNLHYRNVWKPNTDGIKK